MNTSMDSQNDEHSISNNIIRTPDSDYIPSGGLGSEFFRLMKIHGKRIAQFVPETEENDTFEDLLRKCIRVALKMRHNGITSDDIVCLCTYNHINACVPFIAATFLGAKVASLDTRLNLADTIHLLKQVKPKIIFVSPESVQMIESALENSELTSILVVFGGTDEHHDRFSEFLEYNTQEERTFQPVSVSQWDTAVIFFSSGTTGLPKGICQNGYSILCQGNNMITVGMVTSVILTYTSLYWVSGVVFLTSSIIYGSTRIIRRTFDPEEIWNIISDLRVTFLFLAPSQAVSMCKIVKPEGMDTSCLLCLATGGGSMPEKYLNQLRDYLPGTFICQVYGQTEVSGLITSFNLNKVKDALLMHRKPLSCGKAVPGIWCKVVDSATGELQGPNQSGELYVKTKYAMNGYHNMDSSGCFDSDGWLQTGDIVYYDDDECFYVIDRIKELIKYKGIHVPPALLESIVNTHPSVKISVVMGVPHEEDGEHPMAVVVLNENHDRNMNDVTEEEIVDFVNGKVNDMHYKLRAGVKFVEEIPMTPSGKPKRQALKKLVLNGEL